MHFEHNTSYVRIGTRNIYKTKRSNSYKYTYNADIPPGDFCATQQRDWLAKRSYFLKRISIHTNKIC